MNIFDGLFKKRRVIEVADSVFGHLTYEGGVWTSLPKPVQEFMITVAASESGPTELQRNRFQTIRSRLAELELQACTFISSHVDMDVTQLSIYSIEIGTDLECQDNHFVLEMCDDKADVIHRVTFEDTVPVAYGTDD